MKLNRHQKLSLLLAASLLLCSCGKAESEPQQEATSAPETTTTAETTTAETTPAEAVETSAAPSKATTGELTAYLWEDYDLAFEYPAGYSISQEESETGNSDILAAETDNSADGMMRISVTEGCYTESRFANLTTSGVCMMMGLEMIMTQGSTLTDITLPHLSGLDADAKKFTVSCQYDGTPANLTVLLVNCFETDRLYAMTCASTSDAYDSYCENLEDYFYLGNCSVSGGAVKQYLQSENQKPQEIDLGYGVTFSLPADWRESSQEDQEDYDSENTLEFQTAQGDYLLLTADEAMPDDSFEALMATQEVGGGSGGLTITGKEARTVNGYAAYLVNETRPSWGLSTEDTIPVITWYINSPNSFIIVAMIDVSGTQTDFIQHPEQCFTFS